MSDTDTSREAVEALMEGVTPGPWEASRCPSNAREIVEHPDLGRIANLSYPDAGDDEANARFIAASRELVPALLDRAEKAGAELVRMAGQAMSEGERANEAEAELATLKAERERLREAMQAAFDTVTEVINPSNYDHDTVCKLNDEVDELLGILQAALGDA